MQNRFGMFIHWGVYAGAYGNEWIKSDNKLTDVQYQRYVDNFEPDLFAPDEWAEIAQNAGMKKIPQTKKCASHTSTPQSLSATDLRRSVCLLRPLDAADSTPLSGEPRCAIRTLPPLIAFISAAASGGCRQSKRGGMP